MGRLQPTTAHDTPDWWSSDEWSTPPPFVDALEKRYSRPFDLDPCAQPETAKAPRYYTKASNGLVQPWEGFVFVNPPYSAPKVWIEKALYEVRRSENQERIWIVLLLPAAVDTGWFHDLILPHADYEFIRGRLRFLGWTGKPIGSPKGGNLLAFLPKGWAR
jgi:phage N-6-adenine-methyltransferase